MQISFIHLLLALPLERYHTIAAPGFAIQMKVETRVRRLLSMDAE